MNEIRYTLRALRNNPAFTGVAILSLALGLGTNTAMFSVVNGILLRPLDYPNASRVVQLSTTQKARTFPRLTGPDVVDIRSAASSLEQVAFYQGGDMGVQLGAHAEFAATYLVTPNFFSVFGTSLALGRAFNDGDVGRSAIVGLPFAQRNFGSAEAAIGRTLRFEGTVVEIVGIAPTAFRFPREGQLWIAISPQPESQARSAYNYRAVALVRDGASIDAANTQLKAIAARLESAFPSTNKDKTFVATPLQEQLVGPVRVTLYFLMGAVSLVLLIACANVANLSLARVTSRRREMAVRAALGATRGTLVRHLFVESGVLAIAGGAVGLLIALAGTRAIARAKAQQIGLPRIDNIQPDWIVFAFAVGVSLAVSVLFGISPALHAARVDLNEALKAGGRGVGGSPSGRLRSALVVVQVALSFALAIGAGLLFRSFLTLNAVDLGFQTQGLLVMYAHYPAQTLDEHVKAARFFEGAADRMKRIPGVAAAAAAMGVPTGQYGSNGAYVTDGQDFKQAASTRQQANFSLATGGYFATMGISLVRGRDFNSGDTYDRPFVAVISESLEHQSFPGQDPIGHTIMCGLESQKWMTIVGVVADIRQDSPAAPKGPTLYMPLQQYPWHANEAQVVMRATVAPATLIESARVRMHALDPDVATKFTTLESMVSESIATPRLRMTLVGSFAAIALLLAIAGMYGVMSYVVVQRIPEFAIRMALGASPGAVVRLMLGQALQLAGAGALVSLAIALSATRILNTMLFGLDATDAMTYAAVLVAMIPVVVVAAAIPAWRAAQADPIRALRSE